MKKFVGILTIALVFVIAAGVLVAQQQSNRGTAVPPPWAWGFATPPGPPAAAPAAPAAPAPAAAAPAPDPTPQKLAGSNLSFTAAQIRGQCPADWFPGDHAQMPNIVACGDASRQIVACSLCHYPNGKGRPENSSVSGLPVSYFIHTMMDFKADNRKSSDPRKANTNRMTAFAKAMTDAEIKAAAEYFAQIRWTPWIRLVETDTVPKTRSANGMWIPLEGAEAGKEPIGQRIIETPENPLETEAMRNPRSGFVAYVPRGSVNKGKALATTGAGKTTQCAVCHGADLEGLGPAPGIAGRSPSLMVRQMFDMQQGSRKGEWTELMKPVVEKLTAEDMLNIAAYTASLTPRAQSSRAAQ
jgi:cytochrome c553